MPEPESVPGWRPRQLVPCASHVSGEEVGSVLALPSELVVPSHIAAAGFARFRPRKTPPSTLSHAVRPYRREDHFGVVAMLSTLPLLYPGGDRWLLGRLRDVEAGHAAATVACDSANPVGIVIETPKGVGKVKLSTLWVDPGHRRHGLATLLLEGRMAAWEATAVAEVYCTVAVGHGATALARLIANGFVVVGIEPKRYGPDRDEMILTWRPPGVTKFAAPWTY